MKKKQAKPTIRFGEGIPGPNELEEAQQNPIDHLPTVEDKALEGKETLEEKTAKNEIPELPQVQEETADNDQKEKDHPPHEDDQGIPDLIKFEKDLKEYFEQLNWRPKSELVTNVPVPLPNPVYQKIKELEPYYTLKQKGFLQEVITRAVVAEVKRMIIEVKTKNIKKKRKS